MVPAMPVSEREALQQRVDELTRETERLDAELAARQAKARAPLDQHLAVLQQGLDAVADENLARTRRLHDLRRSTWQLEKSAGPEGRKASFFRQGLLLGSWLGSAVLAWGWFGVGGLVAWLLVVPVAALVGHFAGSAR